MKTLQRITEKLKTWFGGKAALPRVLLLTLVALVVFALPSASHAAASCDTLDIPCYVAALFVKIFELLTALMGFILIMEVDALIRVAQYANFVSPGPTAVQIGWVVTRDLANMFFIVFLLIIAFSTIIGYEKYAYRNNLRRLLIMAVVINFSKTICGIFIDMSQVLMLTFVNGFKEAAAGNFLAAFQIQKLLDLSKNTVATPDFGLVLAMMLAFVLAAIAASVVLVLLVMMTFRIVMLWILIILSPIAFLTSSFPIGTNYYAQWWAELKKYLTSGPVIAFFLWLALASAQACPNGLGEPSTSTDPNQATCKNSGFAEQSTAAKAEAQGAQNFQTYTIPTEAGKADTILSLVIVICILFAGLKFASESGVAGAGIAKQVRSKAEAYAKRAITAPIGVASAVGGGVYNAAANRAKQFGFGLAGNVASRIPGMKGLGATALARRDEMKEKRREGSAKAKDLAKYNPAAAGSKSRLFGATDGQILEMAEVAAANPKVLEAQQKSGANQTMRNRLAKIAEKDPTKKSVLDNYDKMDWKGIGAGAKAGSPEEQAAKDKQKAILGKFSGEDAKKYMKAGDLNDANVAMLNKGAVSELLTSGKDDQKSATVDALAAMSVDGKLAGYMKEKGMSFADIPAEAYDKGDLGLGARLKREALSAADRDPSLMKKFADNPKMRDTLAPVARADLAAATTEAGKARHVETLLKLGSAQDADLNLAGDEAVGRTVTMKTLNEMEKNAPTDNPESIASLERAITAALTYGTAKMAEDIMKSPMLSQHVKSDVADQAVKSTESFTRNTDSAGRAEIADLERQRKAAAQGSPAEAAIKGLIANLETAIQGVKGATKDLATAETQVTKLQRDYAQAQKTPNNAAQAAAIAAALKTAITAANAEKAKVARANDHLKSLT